MKSAKSGSTRMIEPIVADVPQTSSTENAHLFVEIPADLYRTLRFVAKKTGRSEDQVITGAIALWCLQNTEDETKGHQAASKHYLSVIFGKQEES